MYIVNLAGFEQEALVSHRNQVESSIIPPGRFLFPDGRTLVNATATLFLVEEHGQNNQTSYVFRNLTQALTNIPIDISPGNYIRTIEDDLVIQVADTNSPTYHAIVLYTNSATQLTHQLYIGVVKPPSLMPIEQSILMVQAIAAQVSSLQVFTNSSVLPQVRVFTNMVEAEAFAANNANCIVAFQSLTTFEF